MWARDCSEGDLLRKIKKKKKWLLDLSLSFKVAAESDRKVKKVKMSNELEPREGRAADQAD